MVQTRCTTSKDGRATARTSRFPSRAAIDLDSYLAERVYPALFSRLDVAFPEFGWSKRGDAWVATDWPSAFPCPVNEQRPARLVVYPDRPWWIKVHGHEAFASSNS